MGIQATALIIARAVSPDVHQWQLHVLAAAGNWQHPLLTMSPLNMRTWPKLHIPRPDASHSLHATIVAGHASRAASKAAAGMLLQLRLTPSHPATVLDVPSVPYRAAGSADRADQATVESEPWPHAMQPTKTLVAATGGGSTDVVHGGTRTAVQHAHAC